MERIEFKITIDASKQHVWETMLNADTYKQWTTGAWPDSFYEGTWKKDAEIKFMGPDRSGTLAKVVDIKPYDHLLMDHIAILLKDGGLDKDSEQAEGWVGTLEEYTFTEKNGSTELTVNIETGSEWKAMFDETWPQALKLLKSISERTGEAVRA